MNFRIYIGRRQNSRGLVELSLRFRAGKIDRQSPSNVWIRPPEDGSRFLTYKEAPELLTRMMAYIEDSYCLVRHKNPDGSWLSDTIDRFYAEEAPAIEMEKREVVGIIDEFIRSTCGGTSSESRDIAYAMLRKSIARYVAFRRLRVPNYRLGADRLDEAGLRAIESFMAREHEYISAHPSIARGYGLEGRIRPKSRNTVNDRMKLLKAVMRWAVKTRLIIRNPLDCFVQGRNVYGTPVYLTLDERRRVERCNLSAKPQLAMLRDMFVFQCCVGCRVGDLMRLTSGNIIDGELNYVPRKTRDGSPITIKVPLNLTARKILRRYADSSRNELFPKIVSRAVYNIAIKRILKKAGVTRRVVVVNPLTREAECRRICEVASSHMARRTFIGNIYKKFKDQNLVSELSGHAPGSRAFTRYREIDPEMKKEMVTAID